MKNLFVLCALAITFASCTSCPKEEVPTTDSTVVVTPDSTCVDTTATVTPTIVVEATATATK